MNRYSWKSQLSQLSHIIFCPDCSDRFIPKRSKRSMWLCFFYRSLPNIKICTGINGISGINFPILCRFCHFCHIIFLSCTFCTIPFQSANSAEHFFFERYVQKLSVSCSYIFLVVVNHSRTYYGPEKGAEADSYGYHKLFKTYVHVRSGNEMVTEMEAK